MYGPVFLIKLHRFICDKMYLIIRVINNNLEVMIRYALTSAKGINMNLSVCLKNASTYISKQGNGCKGHVKQNRIILQLSVLK